MVRCIWKDWLYAKRASWKALFGSGDGCRESSRFRRILVSKECWWMNGAIIRWRWRRCSYVNARKSEMVWFTRRGEISGVPFPHSKARAFLLWKKWQAWGSSLIGSFNWHQRLKESKEGIGWEVVRPLTKGGALALRNCNQAHNVLWSIRLVLGARKCNTR